MMKSWLEMWKLTVINELFKWKRKKTAKKAKLID